MSLHPLKRERELRGWSQAKVAQEIGTTARTVHRWEHGQGIPYPYYRERLCLLFGKNARELGLLPEGNQESEATPSSYTLLPSVAKLDEHMPGPYDPLIPWALVGGNSLIGRDLLLAQLKRRILSGGTLALTALYGLPGIGKTALAVALAADPEVQRHFRDGILWAGLGTQPNVLGLLAHWGSLLGVSSTQVGDVSSREAWGLAVRSAIGMRRMLLIIDDAWQAEEALAFQVGGPACSHFVTTRLPHIALSCAGEGATEVPQLEEADGLALMARFAPDILTQEAESVYELVRSVGALPLALTLMGKYLGSQAFTRQPRRLHTAAVQLHSTEQRLLLSVPTPLLARSPSLPEGILLSLHAAIAVSDQQLSKQARKALQALSVFPAKPNSFPENLALALVEGGERVLDELSDAGLLESSGPGRYTLHQTISDYARMNLKGTTIDRRWVTSTVAYVEAHQGDYAQLDPDINNILAAFETAYQLGLHKELIRGVSAFAPFLHARGLHTVAAEYLLQAYMVAKSLGDPSDIIAVSSHLGEISCLLGANIQAEAYLQEGLALAREQDDQAQICRLLTALGFLATFRGKPAQAKVYTEEGLAIARRLGLQKQIVDLLIWLAWAVYEQRDFALAAACCQEAFPLALQINNREALCLLHVGLGWVSTAVGNHEQAERFYQEGMAIAEQLQHRYCISLLLTGQGWLAGKVGNYAESEDLSRQALAVARQISVYDLIYRLLTSLGWLAEKRGAFAEAEASYQEALSLVNVHEQPRMLCMVLFHLGKLHLKQGQLEEATAFFQDMLAQIPEDDQDLVARAQDGLALVAHAQRQPR